MKRVYGKYASATEARRAVEELLDRGYTKDQIKVISNEDLSSNLDARHDGDTDNDLSLWEKIKGAFTYDQYSDDYWGRDIADDDRRVVEEYRNDLQAGQSVVLVEDDADTTVAGRNAAYTDKDNLAGTAYERDTDLDDRNRLRDDYDRERNTTEEEVLELKKEKLNIDKDRVETGEVNVRKVVKEETQNIEVPVEKEEIIIERRRGDGKEVRDGDLGDGVWDENDEIHIPISEERVEVNKKTVVDDEISIKKVKHQDTENITETVRHEDIEVDGDADIRGNVDGNIRRDDDDLLTDDERKRLDLDNDLKR